MKNPDDQDFDRLAQLQRQDFDGSLGENFLCDLVSESFVLQKATDLSRSDGVPCKRPPFTLQFWHPEHLTQRVYPLRHRDLGRLPIFLVPIGPSDDGYAYEAVFH